VVVGEADGGEVGAVGFGGGEEGVGEVVSGADGGAGEVEVGLEVEGFEDVVEGLAEGVAFEPAAEEEGGGPVFDGV
jgi:hypothetical protein